MTTSKRATGPTAEVPARKSRQASSSALVPALATPPKSTTAKRGKPADAVPVKTARAQVVPKAEEIKTGQTLLDSVRPRLRAKAAEAEEGLVSGLVHHLQGLPAKLLARLGTASDLAAVLVKAQMPKPANQALVDQAAHFLRDLREAAQLSLDDLAKALTLEDASLLTLVESGKVGLPFDIILRMATVLGKNDPVGFILKVTRAYNPGIWATLDKLGIGKLIVQAGREREFANVYRANEAARLLNDEEFAAVLRFVGAALDSGVVFQQQANARGARP